MSPARRILCFIFVSCFSVGTCHPLSSLLIDEHQDNMIDLSYLGVMLYSEPDESVGRLVRDWSPDHGHNPEELGSYLEGDMLIPGVEGRNGLVKTSSRWPNGVVPFQIAPNIGTADRNMILRAMDEYHKNTCIKFVPYSNENNYLYIESSSSGCWSSVGMIGKRQSLNLQSPGCVSMIGTPIHELMHALGFLHEQNRYDRDGFVRVITSNIKPGEKFNDSKSEVPNQANFYFFKILYQTLRKLELVKRMLMESLMTLDPLCITHRRLSPETDKTQSRLS